MFLGIWDVSEFFRFQNGFCPESGSTLFPSLWVLWAIVFVSSWRIFWCVALNFGPSGCLPLKNGHFHQIFTKYPVSLTSRVDFSKSSVLKSLATMIFVISESELVYFDDKNFLGSNFILELLADPVLIDVFRLAH